METKVWNILECELATLSESRQCKKLISWSGDDGMDLVVSWGLTEVDLTLETLWNKFEEFCKPQSNEVRARFDLLTSFRQGDKSVDEWFNAVQAQINLCNYPSETASILQWDIFWFYLRDEEFVSKTLNEGCADLQQYPASKVWQLAKKSSGIQQSRLSLKTWMSSRQDQTPKTEGAPNDYMSKCNKWQTATNLTSNQGWWYDGTPEAHHNFWRAPYSARTSKRDPSLLDL